MEQTYFTDQEYRLVLQALQREREVCENVEMNSKNIDSKQKLTSIMSDIGKKIRYIQYHYYDICGQGKTAKIGVYDETNKTGKTQLTGM